MPKLSPALLQRLASSEHDAGGMCLFSWVVEARFTKSIIAPKALSHTDGHFEFNAPKSHKAN